MKSLLSTALVFSVLFGSVFGANVAQAATGTAVRVLPSTYAAGAPVNVSINVTPQSGVIVYALEETAPSGWVVSNINNSGVFDAATQKVKWGPFFENTAKTLSYTVTPPAGATGVATFNGNIAFDSNASFAIGGATTISPVVVAPTTYPLSVSKTGTGTVTSTDGTINCGATCTANYNSGASVTLNAAPATGWTFAGWSGACSGTASCIVSMTAAKAVSATFTQNSQTLTVSKLGNGSGTVTSSPAGINCGVTCSFSFTQGSVVTLTATPSAGSSASWTGCDSVSGSNCTVTLNTARTVSATFTLASYMLSASKNGSGTIVSNDGLINCGLSCSANYPYGTNVTLSASPLSGWTFAGWSGSCTGNASCLVSMTAAKSVIASFTQNAQTLTVSKAGNGSGTVVSSPVGISCGVTCSASFAPGVAITLTATPSAGSEVTWAGCDVTSGNVCTVTLSAARTVTATFSLSTYLLSVSRTGSGTVTSNDGLINCGATCTGTYNYNATVTLSAAPVSGWTFAGWAGACTGTSSCVVSMTAAKSVNATFTQNPQTLTVSKNGTGTGTVTSSPAGIDCGVTCSASFTQGTAVALTATPSTGSTVAWTGCDSTSGNICNVALTASRSVTATFTLSTYNLSVAKTGSGTIASTDGGINCGVTCSANYSSGTNVALTATPVSGWTFSGWSGACTGTASCVVSMTSAKTVNATFTQNSTTLTVVKNGTGTGTVTSNPAGINCGTTCVASFTQNTLISLIATPATGSSVVWTGCDSSSGTVCNLTLGATRTVTATFTVSTFPLTVTKTGSGTVTSTDNSISCGVTCSANYNSGATVTLNATPASGWTFSGWGGDCTGQASCTVSMTAAHAVDASFAQIPVVTDTIAPTVSITSPMNGATVNTRSSLTISANAADNVAVKSVKFTLNGMSLPEDFSAPYTATTGRLSAGGYTITAQAVDTSGNISNLASVTVNAVAKTRGGKKTLSAPLSLGLVSSDVVTLQQFLNENGYIVAPVGPGSPGNETTYFGKGTQNAVRLFQEAYRNEILVPSGLQHGNGYVGLGTIKKINEMIEASTN